MHCLELIKFDVSNTSYYVEIENGALSRRLAVVEDDPWRSRKIMEKSRKMFREKSV